MHQNTLGKSCLQRMIQRGLTVGNKCQISTNTLCFGDGFLGNIPCWWLSLLFVEDKIYLDDIGQTKPESSSWLSRFCTLAQAPCPASDRASQLSGPFGPCLCMVRVTAWDSFGATILGVCIANVSFPPLVQPGSNNPWLHILPFHSLFFIFPPLTQPNLVASTKSTGI